jgi:hypothetical protein
MASNLHEVECVMTGNSPSSADADPDQSKKPIPENEAQTAPDETGADFPALLDAHKGKLAVGVAATLGLMIYYNLKKKKLPEEDPEGYARLQKLKDSLRAETAKRHGENPSATKSRKEHGAKPSAAESDATDTGASDKETGT